MNESLTNILDNQMRPMIIQEWHFAEWWPTAPYSQNDVPFLLNEIQGFVNEVEVE